MEEVRLSFHNLTQKPITLLVGAMSVPSLIHLLPLVLLLQPSTIKDWVQENPFDVIVVTIVPPLGPLVVKLTRHLSSTVVVLLLLNQIPAVELVVVVLIISLPLMLLL